MIEIMVNNPIDMNQEATSIMMPYTSVEISHVKIRQSYDHLPL